MEVGAAYSQIKRELTKYSFEFVVAKLTGQGLFDDLFYAMKRTKAKNPERKFKEVFKLFLNVLADDVWSEATTKEDSADAITVIT
jgi:hypothetical protein